MKPSKSLFARSARYLTFSNIVACMALFIALGGISYAAVTLPKNSVGAKQIKKNAVASSEIKRNAVSASEIKSSAVTSGDIKNEAVTGSDVNESTLGNVPSASTTADRVFVTQKVNSSASDAVEATARAAAAEVPLASHGSVSVYAKCFKVGANLRFETFARTTANGSVIGGYSVSDSLYGNPALNTSTLEDARQLTVDSTGTNAFDEDTAESATLLGPDGVGLLFNIFAIGREGNPADPTPFTPNADSCYFQLDGRKIG